MATASRLSRWHRLAPIAGFIAIWLAAMSSVAAGTLEMTDQGTYRRIDFYDAAGHQYRFQVLETASSTSYYVRMDPGPFSYNLSYSAAEYLCEKLYLQQRDASASSMVLENFTVMYQSSQMVRLKWDFELVASNVNETGEVWMTVYNGLKWPYAFISFEIDVNDPSSDPGSSNTDLCIESHANEGFFDDDGAAQAAHYDWKYHNAYWQWDDTNGGMGQAVGCFGYMTSSGSATAWYQWSNGGGAQPRYQKTYKLYNVHVWQGHVVKGTYWYTVFVNTTAPDEQWDSPNTLGDSGITTVTTGTEKGWWVNKTAYVIEAASRQAVWQFNGTSGVTYTPIWLITGLSGNTSSYIVKNGTTTMTKGTDYYAYWDSSNGELYVWFPEASGGSVQTYTVEEGTTNTDPSVTSPADVTYSYGQTGNTLSWTVTDPEQASGAYTIYRDGSKVQGGTWTNATAITVSVDGLTVGTYTYSISATDGQGGTNATDSATVTVKPSLKIQSYSVDLAAAKVYVKLVYAHNDTAISGGTVKWGSLTETTNTTGWAAFTPTGTVSNGTLAYGYNDGKGNTYPYVNKTIPYSRKTVSPFTIAAKSPITNTGWTDIEGKLTFTASGQAAVECGIYGEPLKVEVDNVVWTNWTYYSSTQRLVISGLSSDVAVYWTALGGQGGGVSTGGGGSAPREEEEEPTNVTTPPGPRPQPDHTPLQSAGIVILVILIAGALIYRDVAGKEESVRETYRKTRAKHTKVDYKIKRVP